MEPSVLIVFDYSGTLSLQAPEFAQSDHLMRQLAQSGLTDFGIDRAAVFWEDIVNPTWEEGSTTGVGYIPLIVSRVKGRLCRLSGHDPGNRDIFAAAASFVRAYLDHSVIDPSWRHLLKKLSNMPEIMTVIATDHYAEATDAILAHLKEMKIPAVAMRDLKRVGVRPGNTVVANSADLGVHKSQRRFWEIVRAQISSIDIRRVLIVDDFGSREQTGDAYGASDRVALRRRQTLDMMKSVFDASVNAVDIIAGSPEGPRQSDDALIRKAIREIEAYLTPP